jgi:hypothetical protein
MGGQALPVNAAAVPFRDDKTARCLRDIRHGALQIEKLPARAALAVLPAAPREPGMAPKPKATAVTRLLLNQPHKLFLSISRSAL